MKRAYTILPLVALTAIGMAGCKDFLTGGQLSNDPNRPTVATDAELFEATQVNLWATLGSDLARTAGLFTQQYIGTGAQQQNIYTYGTSEGTAGGFYAGLYTGGGLVDLRKLEASVSAKHDSLFLGIAQTEEAALIGTGADVFGDIVYTQALKGTPNPALDPQLAVYDSVQALLDRAIVNLSTQRRSPAPISNVGPGAADLVYGGSRTAEANHWIRLAHTLKARFLSHTANVRTNVWPQVEAEAKLGMQTAADDYHGVFSGSTGEQAFPYQFDQNRAGNYGPGTYLVGLLQARSDPRLDQLFAADNTGAYTSLSAAVLDPTYPQPFITAGQNLTLEAEAAFRAGDIATANSALTAARTYAGLDADAATSGPALLQEILTEEYIADFNTIEAWQLYNRTCFPNLAPTVTGKKIPARLLYDVSERNTDTSIPEPSAQPIRNQVNRTPLTQVQDLSGQSCLGQ